MHPIGTAAQTSLSHNSHSSHKTNSDTSSSSTDEPAENGTVFLAPQAFMDYSAEDDEPADLALAHLIPDDLSLMNLPLARPSSVAAQPEQTTIYEDDLSELTVLIPKGLSNLSQIRSIDDQPW
ncbi:MAG: Peptidyl-tRNA hydrolase [Phormidesmis priestleyi Ana]|uniref:Peptidyl-tRNA hydrolase n=1 Tax=Phormidesmis priestleyi Ana TaxID=1666911 RepID=A0A0P8DGV3_9CYAN|nr:MAG: Peptidyl-tRNA hydrolase [Phormidesmis priestleyi Ana]